MKTLVVYSKICLECHDERWVSTRAWLMAQDYVIKQRRTALNPIWHKLATKAAGTEDYKPFILYPDKTIKTVKEVEDEKDEKLSQVRRNETAKPVRKSRVARKKSKASKEA